MFKAADLVLLTKCDLVPHLDVDLAKVHDALARVMPRPRAIEVSARTGKGLDQWIAWLEELRRPMISPALPLKEVRMHSHGGHTHGPGEGHEHEHAHEHEHSHGGKPHSHPHVHRHGHPHDHGSGSGHEHGGVDHAHDHADHDHEHS
jgi:hydrogenase nickel incorporation protein HypB